METIVRPTIAVLAKEGAPYRGVLFVGLMLTAVNKDYMDPLYSTHPGHVILAIALSMMFVGTVVLRQMVRFKG
jgi:hypothetical protein